MAASAVSLTYLSDVVPARSRRPRVGTDGDLGAKFTLRERDVVGRFRIKIIGNELVIAVDAGVGQIKFYDAAFVNRTLFYEIDRAPMTFEDRFELCLYLIAFDYFIQRTGGER